jgi:uncharacterized protein (DUF1330 family)
MTSSPTPEQLQEVTALAGTKADAPLVMLNLNRYRERARYESAPPGGESPDVTGREAYERYAVKAVEVLAREGGEVLWATEATMTVVGDESDRWHEVIAVRYPSMQAFLGLALDPEIGIALAHREAGLERAALIRCDDGGQVPLHGG